MANDHKPGCDALGGYGHGVGPCTCGALTSPVAPEQVVAAERDQARIDLELVYAAFGIGHKARQSHILMENLCNVLRRERCLAAIERTFFMVPTEPDEEDGGEPGEECLLNWGQDPDDYVATFREALKAIAASPEAAPAAPLLMQDENSGRDGRRYNEWHASRPDARLNAREAAAALKIELPPPHEAFTGRTGHPVYTADQVRAIVYDDRKERQLAACNFCLAQAAEAREAAKAAATPAAPSAVTDQQIAALKAQFGVTSNGRGIREFTQVKDFALAVAALAQPAPVQQTKPDDHVWVKCPNGHGDVTHQWFDHCGCCPVCGATMTQTDAPVQAGAQQAVADGSTPGLWFVRKRERDGELLDCFVAAPDFLGLPYDAEILGDDEYRDGKNDDRDDSSGIKRKLADCELIVKAVNAYRAAPTQAGAGDAKGGA